MATIGKNIEARIEKNKLILEIDLSQDFGRSASGKSQIIASSEGNAPAPGQPEIKIGLNVYRPAKK